MRSKFRIICLTSDKYVWAVRPLSYLMKKYWPDHPEVVVGGYSLPNFEMPDKFSFVSIGRFEDYPISRWSDGLIRLLSLAVPDKIFMLMLEDMWPVRAVKTGVIDMIYDYMEQFNYVARFDLTHDRAGAYGGNVETYGMLGDIEIVWSDPNSPYHMSLMPGMWRRDHLLRVLLPGESPWDVEIQGTGRLGRLRGEMIVLGTKVWPYKNLLAFRGGNSNELILNDPMSGTGGLSDEVIEDMRRLGLLRLE